MLAGFILIGVGLSLAFGTAIFGLMKIRKIVNDATRLGKSFQAPTLGSIAKDHLGATIVMTVGGFCALAGSLVVIWSILKHLLK